MDASRRLVVLDVSGTLTLNEILDAIHRSVTDPAYQPGFGVLSDHTAVEEPLTPSQAREMAARLEELSASLGGSRWAVVTAQPASYGMIRMVSALVEPAGIDVRVFSSHEEAEAWLASRRESAD